MVQHWCAPDALGDGWGQSLSHRARSCEGEELDDFLQPKACLGKSLGLKEEA